MLKRIELKCRACLWRWFAKSESPVRCPNPECRTRNWKKSAKRKAAK